jgi:hypothetical protein
MGTGASTLKKTQIFTVKKVTDCYKKMFLRFLVFSLVMLFLFQTCFHRIDYDGLHERIIDGLKATAFSSRSFLITAQDQNSFQSLTNHLQQLEEQQRREQSHSHQPMHENSAEKKFQDAPPPSAAHAREEIQREMESIRRFQQKISTAIKKQTADIQRYHDAWFKINDSEALNEWMEGYGRIFDTQHRLHDQHVEFNFPAKIDRIWRMIHDIKDSEDLRIQLSGRLQVLVLAIDMTSQLFSEQLLTLETWKPLKEYLEI